MEENPPVSVFRNPCSVLYFDASVYSFVSLLIANSFRATYSGKKPAVVYR